MLNKISHILREEMGRIGGNEMLMPSLFPREILEESGRDKVDVLFTVPQHDYFLGFTHEEVITAIARGDIQSYKQLPFLPYQIQTKFRNEPRPRGGLIRGREFLMLDAYSFDRDAASQPAGVPECPRSIPPDVCPLRAGRRCAAEADSGRYWRVAERGVHGAVRGEGEDTVLRCDKTGYAANAERCEADPRARRKTRTLRSRRPRRRVTPGVSTIEDVAGVSERPRHAAHQDIDRCRPGRPAGRCAGARGPGTARGQTGEAAGWPVAAGRCRRCPEGDGRPSRFRRAGRAARLMVRVVADREVKLPSGTA